MILDSLILTASPTEGRQQKFVRIVREFLSSERQPASLWRSLLGHMSSLTQLVPGGRLRMRSLQAVLRKRWDFVSEETLLSWDQSCQQDLHWWLDEERLKVGCSLKVIPPDLMFWSDASDEGWGAHLGGSVVSGLWSPEERLLSINLRELKAIGLGLRHFQHQVEGHQVAVFADNTTALAYLRKEGGTISPSLNREAQDILRWAERIGLSLSPQFILGEQNVVADALSRASQVIGTEWTLCQDVFNHILERWPATVDLFATSLSHRLPVYYSPLQDPQSAGTDALLQTWDFQQLYAFPPFSLIRRVVNKLLGSRGTDLTLIAPLWPQKEWFPDLLGSLVEPPLVLPLRRDLLRQPHFHRYHLGLQSLHLHAWRLSSDSPGMKGSLDEWRSRCPLLEGVPLV